MRHVIGSREIARMGQRGRNLETRRVVFPVTERTMIAAASDVDAETTADAATAAVVSTGPFIAPLRSACSWR